MKKMLFCISAVAAVLIAGCMSKPSRFYDPSSGAAYYTTPQAAATNTCTATVTVTPCCGAISGNVSAYDCTADPASAAACAGARIKAFSGGIQKAVTIADASGNYLLETLGPGSYDLQIQILRYGIDSSITGINVSAGNLTSDVNLTAAKQWQENTICFDDPGLLTATDVTFLLNIGVGADIQIDIHGNMIFTITSIPDSLTPDGLVQQFNATSPGTLAHKCMFSCP
jgi:hypothetical protein